MSRMFRSSLALSGCLMLATACGSSASTSADSVVTTAAAVVTTAPATTAAPAATTAAPAATTAAPAATSAPAATTAAPAAAASAAAASFACGPAAAGAVEVSVIEWAIKTSAPLKAGKVGMTVLNTGGNVHELAIVKADSFASLPKTANGAIDEAKLAPGALIGRTEKLGGGKSCPVTVDLQPGKYVMVCNISFGPNSHAAKGQVLDVEVVA